MQSINLENFDIKMRPIEEAVKDTLEKYKKHL